jgi:hypothetical protein
MGFGIGGRAGAAFHGIYGGVSAIYYVGSSDREGCSSALGVGLMCNMSTYKVSTHSYQYGVDVGYGYTVFILTIRGQLGIGDYGLSGTVDGVTSSSTKDYSYLEPALVGIVSLGTFFVGADVDTLLLPNGPNFGRGGAISVEDALRRGGA